MLGDIQAINSAVLERRSACLLTPPGSFTSGFCSSCVPFLLCRKGLYMPCRLFKQWWFISFPKFNAIHTVYIKSNNCFLNFTNHFSSTSLNILFQCTPTYFSITKLQTSILLVIANFCRSPWYHSILQVGCKSSSFRQ